MKQVDRNKADKAEREEEERECMQHEEDVTTIYECRRRNAREPAIFSWQ